MILLFDIDGTLLTSGAAGRRAMIKAFDAVLGVADAMAGVRLHGSTDLAILEDAFRIHLSRTAEDGEYDRVFEAYYEALATELAEATCKVLDGAKEIAQAALDAGYEVGLATGNVERGAWMKLERGGIADYFSFGGFGSDAKARADVVRAGVGRGQTRFAERHGRNAEREEIFVIGDTEKDVHAARDGGGTAVGVLQGSAFKDELIASKPDVLVDSLASDDLWARLGLK